MQKLWCMGSKFVVNFKGYICNFTQNCQPIHRKICILDHQTAQWLQDDTWLFSFSLKVSLAINRFEYHFDALVVFLLHDDVIKWKNFPRYWPFVRGIHRSPVNSPHKGQWRGALMFSLIYARTNGWVNTGDAGDLRRKHAHYDVIVMKWLTGAREIMRHFVC